MMQEPVTPVRRVNRGLAALLFLSLLLPAARPAGSAPRYLVRVDGSVRGEVSAGAFRLSSPQDLQLQVVGAWYKEKLLTDCWVLDAASREAVWELDKEQCRSSCDYGFTCDTSLTLDAGQYEIYFSTVKTGSSISFRGVDPEAIPGFLKKIFGDSVMLGVLGGGDFDRRSGQARWGARILAPDGAGADASPARMAADENPKPGELVRIRRAGGKCFETRAFQLSEPAEIEIYALGEGEHEKMYDHGWLVRSADRSRPWKMDFANTTHAGGAQKNRLARVRLTLEAGRYEVWYVTDDSHHWGAWNQPPPRDPDFWGITVCLVVPEDGSALPRHRADLPAFPADRVIASIRRPGNNSISTRVVRMRKGGSVMFYGIGEGDDDGLVDWGWVKDCRSGEVIWAMDAKRAVWAGGAGKNRMNEEAAHLEPGEYVVTYVTDDSHSGGGGWNASPPWDAERAGLTLYWTGAEADPGSYVSYSADRSPGLLGMIPAVGNNADRRVSFELRRPATVRVVCQGEGGQSEMHDYGWIERAEDGQRVWTMNFDISNHAGGARKNREWRGEIQLPAGSYRLRYISDDSHSFNDWNANPPRHRGADWGISVYRLR